MRVGACDLMQRPIEGDMPTLPTSALGQHISLGVGETLLWSGDDLRCCFCVHDLNDSWLLFVVFVKEVSAAALRLPGGGEVWVAARVIAMGWVSATGVI